MHCGAQGKNWSDRPAAPALWDFSNRPIPRRSLVAGGAEMDEPSWIVTVLVSGIVGWSLPYVGRVLYYCVRRLKKDHLEGEWYGYHWTYKSGLPILNKSTWHIGKGVLHRFCVRYAHQDGMSYRGYAQVERAQLVVRIHSTRNQETPYFRFTWPIASNAEVLQGIWMSFDHDVHIASGAHILSRKALTDEEAIGTIKETMRWEKSYPVMKVKGA